MFSQEESCNCPGAAKKGKGSLYISWGYNRDWYSRSDLHFKNSGTDDYDFTLYGVKAEDRPGFRWIPRNAIRGDFTRPQYSARLGYYFPKKPNMGVEINFDHSKYVMISDQTVHITGQIHEKSLDRDTVLSAGFLKFEHTNGANFLMVNFVERKNLFHSQNGKHWLSLVIKTGGGLVIPKTDVTLFGKQLDNCFHTAGWLAGVDTGLRYDFRHFFTEFTAKGVFADYRNVLVIGTGRVNHHFGAFETILTAGYQLGL